MLNSASICGLLFTFSVYAIANQNTIREVTDTVQLTDDMHFKVANRLTFAMSCCKTISSCGFFFSKAGRCQCLKEYGGYEIWTANLKRISASYIGCYHDAFDRVLPHGIMQNVTDLTTETCMQHCQSISYIYFGTECTNQCFCGHVIKPGHAKVPDKECNMPCAGDSSLRCGGYFRTSIYKINI